MMSTCDGEKACLWLDPSLQVLLDSPFRKIKKIIKNSPLLKVPPVLGNTRGIELIPSLNHSSGSLDHLYSTGKEKFKVSILLGFCNETPF